MIRIIQGQLRGQKIFSIKSNQTRPTKSFVREAVFNMLQPVIEGSTFLDLFAGSGAMGFEALSGGAKKVVFVEHNIACTKMIYKNASRLKVLDRISIILKKAATALPRLDEQFDLIYMDPPYAMARYEEELTQLLTCLYERNLLSKSGAIFLELDATTTLPSNFSPQFSKQEKKYGSTKLLLLRQR